MSSSSGQSIKKILYTHIDTVLKFKFSNTKEIKEF